MDRTSFNTCNVSRSKSACLGAFVAILLLLISGESVAAAGLDPSQVAILVNKDTPISSQVSRMYEKLRAIPPANILSLSLGPDRQITSDQFWSKAAPPIKKYLEANPESPLHSPPLPESPTPSSQRARTKALLSITNSRACSSGAAGRPEERSGESSLFVGGGNLRAITDPQSSRWCLWSAWTVQT